VSSDAFDFQTGTRAGKAQCSRVPGALTITVGKIKSIRKIALFIDGCFWHGCSLHFRLPKTNKKYWSQKISCNIERDKRTNKELRKMGWKVVRIWEHDIKSDRLKKRLIKLLLHGNISFISREIQYR
ncbi:hypothetical protein IBX73_11420, partial [candidate division WOR-3 bacterium]|nr:hypothetical protein [candidate division WOR-3 bacterium]